MNDFEMSLSCRVRHVFIPKDVPTNRDTPFTQNTALIALEIQKKKSHRDLTFHKSSECGNKLNTESH